MLDINIDDNMEHQFVQHRQKLSSIEDPIHKLNLIINEQVKSGWALVGDIIIYEKENETVYSHAMERRL